MVIHLATDNMTACGVVNHGTNADYHELGLIFMSSQKDIDITCPECHADYPMANNNLDFKAQHARLKASRLTSLGFGGGTTLLMMVPVLNFLAMPAAVAGATVYWHEHLQKSTPNDQAKK